MQPPGTPQDSSCSFSPFCLKPWLHVQKKRNFVQEKEFCSPPKTRGWAAARATAARVHHLSAVTAFAKLGPKGIPKQTFTGKCGGCAACSPSLSCSTTPAWCIEGETPCPPMAGRLREPMKPKTGCSRHTLPKWAQRREKEQLRGRNEVMQIHSPWTSA